MSMNCHDIEKIPFSSDALLWDEQPKMDKVELRTRAAISCTILTAVAGALRRCPTLAVLVPRRVGRLALHPATTIIIAQLIAARALSPRFGRA